MRRAFCRIEHDRESIAGLGIDLGRPGLQRERQVELAFRQQHRRRLAGAPFQQEIGHRDRDMRPSASVR
jgi:hypothetical protein